MKSVVSHLAKYKSVHLNPINVKYHFAGIPLCVGAILVFLGEMRLDFGDSGSEISLASFLVIGTFCYYFMLHVRLAFCVLLGMLPLWGIAMLITSTESAMTIGLVMFLGGWMIQVVGHIYERTKPVLIEDVKQLIIGPLFLAAEFYFYLGREKGLERQISVIAFRLRNEYDVRNNKTLTL